MRPYSILTKSGLLAFLFLLSACGSKNLIVVLPDENGKTGSVVVQQGGQSLVLDKAYASTQLSGSGNAEAVVMERNEVERVFANVLAARPVPPVSFNLYFKEGGTELTPESVPVREQIFQEIKKRPVTEITVIGHTDRVGTVQSNDTLALKRANSVMKSLVELGIKPESIDAAGRGEREPLVQTGDEVAEPRNRRTEINIR
ncbi:MAG: OmpA family protein [Magnetococcales bacterium]|nr:OmpA family protein [Magnetococcales bacterium]